MSMLKHLIGVTSHKAFVTYYASKFAARLIIRSLAHDLSKYRKDEARGFARLIHILATETYGSDAYKEALTSPCIQTHYKRNRHHPEHHPLGLRGMSLMDVVEMWCDWQAATKRSPHGSVAKSLDMNEKRFDKGVFGPARVFDLLRNEVGLYHDPSEDIDPVIEKAMDIAKVVSETAEKIDLHYDPMSTDEEVCCPVRDPDGSGWKPVPTKGDW